MKPNHVDFSNYRKLVEMVDALCRQVTDVFQEVIACRAGCDTCCRHISLFPVEGFALAEALRSLPELQAGKIRKRAAMATPDGPCPLMKDGLCLLYDARPIICRTHGLPVLAMTGGERNIDFCPKNFKGVPSLPGSAVIDLDRLNVTLAAVNTLFLTGLPSGEALKEQRISVAAGLQLDLPALSSPHALSGKSY